MYGDYGRYLLEGVDSLLCRVESVTSLEKFVYALPGVHVTASHRPNDRIVEDAEKK